VTSNAWAASGCKVTSWDLAADWGRALNRPTADIPDRCGTVVWRLLQGSSLSTDPATFSLLDTFLSDTAFACTPGGAGLQAWNSSVGYGNTPAVAVNVAGADQSCNPWAPITIPNTSVFVHPSPSMLAGASWKSPFQGTVLVQLTLTDLDSWGGDGFNWFVEKKAAIQGQGVVTNGGATSFSKQVKVLAGDTIYVMVGPGPNGDYSYDNTRVQLTITRL
jgi:hypothetical protein